MTSHSYTVNSSIVALLREQLTGRLLSEADLEQLQQWREEHVENEQVYQEMQNPAGVAEGLAKLQLLEKEKSNSYLLLLSKIKENEINKQSGFPHRIHFLRSFDKLRTTWFRYAAALILVFGAAAYFWNINKKMGQTIISGNEAGSATLIMDVAPGRDRAILTLANGQQIILDSTQGNIVKRGGLTVINLAGKLKYEGVGVDAEYNTISTPKGGQYQIILPDGSQVWLNAASSIKFPTAFTGNARNVKMMGEAYMEIARNPKQPFTVVANGVEVQVIGTSFNVNAYQDEANVRTTLVNGSVRVLDNRVQPVILKPGQQAIVSSGAQIKIVDNADIEQTLAWKNGAFQFNRTNLADAMRQLARWYDIEVVYEKGIPDIKFWGEMKRDLNLSQVLGVLRKMGVKFRMEGRRLIVIE